jgi:hypothetical protein
LRAGTEEETLSGARWAMPRAVDVSVCAAPMPRLVEPVSVWLVKPGCLGSDEVAARLAPRRWIRGASPGFSPSSHQTA